MRKIIISNMVSIDGYFAGPNDELDWHNVDAEFNDYAIDMLNSVDVLLFGRVTYQLMADYWTTPTAIKNDPIIAGKMNSLQKIAFSKTLDKVEWQNTKLIKGNSVEEIKKLQQQPGKDMALLGSSDLALTFIEHGLIDEYRIIINPVILGNGNPLFKGLKDRLNMKLIKTKVFKSGNVLLYYEQK